MRDVLRLLTLIIVIEINDPIVQRYNVENGMH